MGDGQESNISSPAPDLFWSCAKRLLSFDDPTDRWQKILSLCSRHLRTKPDALAALESGQKESLFNRLFGVQAKESSSQTSIVNVILCLEEMDRLTQTCLDLFFAGAEKEVEPAPQWLLDLNLKKTQMRWVARAVRVSLDWRRLSSEGPWTADPRAQLLVDFINRLGNVRGDLSAAVLSEQRAIFRRMLSAKRLQLPASFLPELILLVEGPTEALILPGMARCLDADFESVGALVLPAGGANQVLRRFLELRDICTLPIVSVLDSDAESQAAILEDSLRDIDRLHVLKSGEIEDVFDEVLFGRLINIHLGELGLAHTIEPAALSGKGRRTTVLERLWREWGLGSFDKIGFAKTIVSSIKTPSQVPGELVEIIESVRQLAGRRCEKTLEGTDRERK